MPDGKMYTRHDIVTRQGTADLLGIGLSTVDRLINRRDHPLPHIRVGRRVLIPFGMLEDWIKEEAERGRVVA